MAILVDANTKVLVQGITGRQGSFHTRLLKQYGTKVLAGTSPGKGGSDVEGVPVYDTVREAVEEKGVNASIVFVPAQFTKEAALEAIEAGLSPIVLIAEGVPVLDSMQILARAGEKGVTIIGPNTPGVISPGLCKLGIMPAHVFEKGVVGVASRSGTLTYEIAAGLTKAGLGQSTCVGLGGDPLVGLSFIDVLELFKNDEETEAVALIGEIGGNAEEAAAEYIIKTNYPKPVVAYVAGRAAPPGKRMGHAGAIISGRTGTAESKLEAFKRAGVEVARKPSEIASKLREALGSP